MSTPVSQTAQLLGGPACELGEGPVWHAEAQELGWVDILGKALHRATLDAEGTLGPVRTTHVGGHLGAAVPVSGPDGGWLLAIAQGFAHLAEDGTLTPLAQPEAASGGGNRMNDAKADPRGRWWAGSMSYGESDAAGSLYRVDLDGSVTPMLTGTSVSNGLGWSPDGKAMYFNDSGTRTLSSFAFDVETGEISDQRILVRGTPESTPDGLTMDDEGCVWTALWDGGSVHRYDPDGELLEVVTVPVQRTSSCCFAGPDRDQLVITTGQVPDKPEADAGRLFVVRPGVTGPPADRFAGTLPR